MLTQKHHKNHHTIEKFCVHKLCIHYKNKKIIDDISFEVKRGEILSIMGPNGVGKSSLMRTLSGFHKEWTGFIGWNNGMTLCSDDRAYLPQQFEGDRVFPLCVQDILHMAHTEKAIYTVKDALEAVGLSKDAYTPLEQLSVGQFQRMLFARLFLDEAPLIMLDEPFTSVDEKTAKDLIDIILRWQDQDKIILVVHHNRERALKYFPTTLLLGCHFYHHGPSKDVLSLSEWTQVHEKQECCS